MNKEISKVWTFRSDSNPNKSYETLQYTDETTSCNCPGWTRRVGNNGQRTCKHIRMVDQGIADNQCVSTHDYQTVSVKTPVKAKPSNKKIVFDEILKPTQARKIHL